MFSTLKIKSIFFIALIMAITAGAIMYFTHREVGRAMIENEESSAQNVLQLAELNIKGGYEKLISEKFDMIFTVKNQLKGISTLSKSTLEGYAALTEDKLISKQEAQKRALSWIKTVPIEKGNLFAFDEKAVIIAHPEPSMVGTSVALLQDIKGRRIGDVMRVDKIKGNGDFAVFFWKDSRVKPSIKKLGYFFPIPRWKWTVCALIDFVDLEAEAQKKMAKIINALRKTFNNIQIAKTGGVFLFNGQGEMLIPPRGNQKRDYLSFLNLKTGNLLLTDLMQAATSDKNPVHYIESYALGDQVIEANVRYFKAFDWYIVVSVPLQEIQQPAKTLVARQSFIIVTIFIGSLIAAYILMSKISRPLKKLAEYAKEIPLQDFTAEKVNRNHLDDLPTKYNDEIGRLAESFMVMETKLKKNIKDVIETQTKYRTILESIEEGFFETDLKGRLTFFNSSLCKMLGYDRDELLGKHYRRFTTPETLRKIYRVFKHVYHTGKLSEIMECEIVRKNGKKRIFELSVYLTKNQSGQPTGFRGVARDISKRLKVEKEKKRLEAQLLQAQKMESLGTLAGGIAHDFNNILSAVIGYTELSILNYAKEAKLRSYLERVLKAGFRARDLVNQILTFSRQTEQELKPVRISPIVKECLNFLRASIPSTIEIRKEIQTRTDCVFSDPTKIHQVLMNLCTNAVHSMWEQGGVLKVRLTDINLQPEDSANYPDLSPGSYLKLTVSDTGHGIDQTTMGKIFDPYFTTKEKGKGTGLGLSVTLGIIKSQGGTIVVTSEPDGGAIFDVYLPTVETADVPEDSFPEPLPMGQERILLIDDEETILEMGKQILQGLGYDVVTQKYCLQALGHFRDHPNMFDLVITDLTMPKMNGMELASEFLKIRPDIPIILCTGFSERLTEKKAQAYGIRKFMVKPLIMRELAVAIREALE